MKNTTLAAAIALALLGVIPVRAVVIDTVYVGNAGNPNDPTTGYGSVSYDYNIGKYEVTVGQYTEFLNSVAATDTYHLYSSTGYIMQTGSSGRYSYQVLGSNANKPITDVSWFDAARFSNWMANGQPVGAQGNATTENGAYTLNGAMGGTNFVKNLVNPITQGVVSWWIPSENEWYKAAYYSPGASTDGYWLYPTQSDSAPGNTSVNGANQANYGWSATSNVGAFIASASHYGTYDQAGNVWEWNDAVISDLHRGLRGSSYADSNSVFLQSSFRGFSDDAHSSAVYIGFRLANVPEPSTVGLVLLAGAAGLWVLNRKRLG